MWRSLTLSRGPEYGSKAAENTRAEQEVIGSEEFQYEGHPILPFRLHLRALETSV